MRELKTDNTCIGILKLYIAKFKKKPKFVEIFRIKIPWNWCTLGV